jgi:hypothetical protein
MGMVTWPLLVSVDSMMKCPVPGVNEVLPGKDFISTDIRASAAGFGI